HALRAGDLARELHASDDVVVGDVAGHARIEAVADAQIHDRLGGRTRVDAAQDHCCGILTLGASFLLGQVVVRRLLSQAKALIALLHQRDDVVRRQLVALRPGQRGSVYEAADGDYAEDRADGRDAGDREKAASVHTIVSTRWIVSMTCSPRFMKVSQPSVVDVPSCSLSLSASNSCSVRGGRPRSSEW